MDLAEKLGPTYGLNTTSPDFDLVNEIKKITVGQGTSITIDTTGLLCRMAWTAQLQEAK